MTNNKSTSWPRLNLAAGPVEVPQRTLREAARPILYHYDPAFKELFARTTGLAKQVFGTEYDIVIMQGEAILGLEAAAASLISPGDKVLNLVSGVFGKWFEDFIHRHGGETIELAVPYNEAIDPDAVRRVLQETPGIRFCSMVHSETPSGTINPVKAIGQVCREFGVITMVDTVSGLGSEHVVPEAWGIDVAIVGPQKCLGGLPGLSLMSISPAAWEAMETASTGAPRQLPVDSGLENRLDRGESLSLHPERGRYVRARINPHPGAGNRDGAARLAAPADRPRLPGRGEGARIRPLGRPRGDRRAERNRRENAGGIR